MLVSFLSVEWKLAHNEQGANVRESVESLSSGTDPQTVAVVKRWWWGRHFEKLQ